MTFTNPQFRRYARSIILPEIGEAGQEKLLRAKVLVIGAGGLGSPCLLYLAASGVGTLGIIDSDKVELSNLQRQVIHETGDIGRLKAQSAADSLHDLNPDIKIIPIGARLDETNAREIISGYDIVADGSDNVVTRFLVNDVCHKLKKTLVSAAILGFEGQLSTFKSYLGEGHPCYRCLYPEPPPQDAMPSCAENGVFPPLAGLMGCMQAGEVLKETLGLESLSGTLIRFDALTLEMKKTSLPKTKRCVTCGQ